MSETVAVATWTLRQIDQARRLYAEAQVADEMVHRHGEDVVLEATRGELFKALRGLAHPFAIELDAGDLELLALRDPTTPWHVTVKARWNPSTNACELRGGPRDGEVIAHQRPGEPLFLPRIAPLPHLVNDDATSAASGRADLADRYELAGWSETHRRWVYEATR